MTRFILSYVMILLFVLAGSAIACAAGNSKRPTAFAPTALSSSCTASTCSRLSHAAHKSAAFAGKQAAKAASAIKDLAAASGEELGNHLARLTAYWSGEGDYYTRHHIASTGIHLHQGHCAVDPTIIPYGSIVQIDGLGSYLAVDTGTAVVSRKAARQSGHNRGERGALVVDLYFENRRDGERFAANGPKFAAVTWSKPDMMAAADDEAATSVLSAPSHSETPRISSPSSRANTSSHSLAATSHAKGKTHGLGASANAEAPSRSLTAATHAKKSTRGLIASADTGRATHGGASTSKTQARGLATASDVESTPRLASTADDQPHGKRLYSF